MHFTLLLERAMIQRFLTGVLVVLVTFAFATTSFAQDAKKEVKKETKPAVTTDVKKDAQKETKPATADAKKDPSKPKKPASMKNVGCTQSGCGFWAKSHSGKELRYIMKRHAKKYHKIELTDKQLKEMVKVEGAK
jgi:predicted small metal-binding protein